MSKKLCFTVGLVRVSFVVPSEWWTFQASILTHADFPVFNTCSSRAKWSTVSILISFAPKFVPEQRTNHIWNISEARLKAPNNQKVILILWLTFFVDTHGRSKCFFLGSGLPAPPVSITSDSNLQIPKTSKASKSHPKGECLFGAKIFELYSKKCRSMQTTLQPTTTVEDTHSCTF